MKVIPLILLHAVLVFGEGIAEPGNGLDVWLLPARSINADVRKQEVEQEQIQTPIEMNEVVFDDNSDESDADGHPPPSRDHSLEKRTLPKYSQKSSKWAAPSALDDEGAYREGPKAPQTRTASLLAIIAADRQRNPSPDETAQRPPSPDVAIEARRGFPFPSLFIGSRLPPTPLDVVAFVPPPPPPPPLPFALDAPKLPPAFFGPYRLPIPRHSFLFPPNMPMGSPLGIPMNFLHRPVFNAPMMLDPLPIPHTRFNVPYMPLPPPLLDTPIIPWPKPLFRAPVVVPAAPAFMPPPPHAFVPSIEPEITRPMFRHLMRRMVAPPEPMFFHRFFKR